MVADRCVVREGVDVARSRDVAGLAIAHGSLLDQLARVGGARVAGDPALGDQLLHDANALRVLIGGNLDDLPSVPVEARLVAERGLHGLPRRLVVLRLDLQAVGDSVRAVQLVGRSNHLDASQAETVDERVGILGREAVTTLRVVLRKLGLLQMLRHLGGHSGNERRFSGFVRHVKNLGCCDRRREDAQRNHRLGGRPRHVEDTQHRGRQTDAVRDCKRLIRARVRC